MCYRTGPGRAGRRVQQEAVLVRRHHAVQPLGLCHRGLRHRQPGRVQVGLLSQIL